MADAADSKSAVRKYVWVRVPPPAPTEQGGNMANRKPGNNQERNPRFTQVLPIDLRVTAMSPTAAGKPVIQLGQDFTGRTINLSADGLLINSDFELDRDTIMDVTIMTGQDGERPIHASVKVAWARRNAFDMFGRWAMGLRILQIEDADHARLQEFFDGDPS